MGLATACSSLPPEPGQTTPRKRTRDSSLKGPASDLDTVGLATAGPSLSPEPPKAVQTTPRRESDQNESTHGG